MDVASTSNFIHRRTGTFGLGRTVAFMPQKRYHTLECVNEFTHDQAFWYFSSHREKENVFRKLVEIEKNKRS